MELALGKSEEPLIARPDQAWYHGVQRRVQLQVPASRRLREAGAAGRGHGFAGITVTVAVAAAAAAVLRGLKTGVHLYTRRPSGGSCVDESCMDIVQRSVLWEAQGIA